MSLSAGNAEKVRCTMRYLGSLAQLPSSLAPHRQPVYAAGSNCANFRNFSMKLSSNISDICMIRNFLKTKIEFLKKLQLRWTH